MNPLASFVIPAYNAQKFLTQTLESCLHQTVKNIEVVVVDDGSTDGTRELLEWYIKQDERIKLLGFGKNQGRSAARNAGNDMATGDFIFVLDSDDIVSRTRVRDTLTVFKTKKPDIVSGGFIEIDELGNRLASVRPNVFVPSLSKKSGFNYICHSTMAYRKGVSFNVRYSEGVYSELGIDDWKFQWDCWLKGYKFASTRDILSIYRKTVGGISSVRDGKKVKEAKDEFLKTIPGEKLLEAV